MKFITFISFILFCTSINIGQIVNFIESPATKSGKVFIPKEIANELPTNDAYTLGYFIYQNGYFINVGQVDLVNGENKEIELGRDLAGNNGYAVGDTLITILKNKSSTKTYGVEFNYTNNARTYYSDYKDSVISIKKSTWNSNPFLGRTIFCHNQETVNVSFPFGLKPSIQTMPTEGLIINDYEIDLKNSKTGTYTILFDNVQIWNQSGFSITINNHSTEKLNAEYIICQEETKIISAQETDFIRTPLVPTTGFEATQTGPMYFSVNYDNGCSTIDTINIKHGEISLNEIEVEIQDVTCDHLGSITILEESISSNHPIKEYKLNDESSLIETFNELEKGEYSITIQDTLGCEFILAELFIDKINDCEDTHLIIDHSILESDHIKFSENTSIQIYNRNEQEVFSGQGSIKWYGTDNEGSQLPAGVYFILLDESTQKTVTIIK